MWCDIVCVLLTLWQPTPNTPNICIPLQSLSQNHRICQIFWTIKTPFKLTTSFFPARIIAIAILLLLTPSSPSLLSPSLPPSMAPPPPNTPLIQHHHQPSPVVINRFEAIAIDACVWYTIRLFFVWLHGHSIDKYGHALHYSHSIWSRWTMDSAPHCTTIKHSVEISQLILCLFASRHIQCISSECQLQHEHERTHTSGILACSLTHSVATNRTLYLFQLIWVIWFGMP